MVMHREGIDLSIRAGLNLSGFAGKDSEGGIKPGVNGGFLADFYITDNIFFQPGLIYSLKGSGKKYDPSPFVTDAYAVETIKTNLHYIEIPLTFGYRFEMNTRSWFYLNTGPYLAPSFSGKIKRITKTGNGQEDKTSLDAFNDNGLEKFDMGWNVGAGVRFGHLFTGLQYGIGILDLAKETNSPKVHNSNISINLGFYF